MKKSEHDSILARLAALEEAVFKSAWAPTDRVYPPFQRVLDSARALIDSRATTAADKSWDEMKNALGELSDSVRALPPTARDIYPPFVAVIDAARAVDGYYFGGGSTWEELQGGIDTLAAVVANWDKA